MFKKIYTIIVLVIAACAIFFLITGKNMVTGAYDSAYNYFNPELKKEVVYDKVLWKDNTIITQNKGSFFIKKMYKSTGVSTDHNDKIIIIEYTYVNSGIKVIKPYDVWNNLVSATQDGSSLKQGMLPISENENKLSEMENNTVTFIKPGEKVEGIGIFQYNNDNSNININFGGKTINFK